MNKLFLAAAAILLTATTIFAQTSGESMGGMQHVGMGSQLVGWDHRA